jgi:ABC-type branched-subunit amino acid transport system ATPase component
LWGEKWIGKGVSVMEVSTEYAVQMHGITKYFGSFCALDHVNLDVKKGTIHAVLGENGAGKSTLMNVLYGLYQADSGEIYLNGKKLPLKIQTWPLNTELVWCISISCWWIISP